MPEGDNPQGGVNKAEELQKLLNKNNGDAVATLGILFSENFDLRDKNRKLKEKVPADDAVILTKEQGAEYEKAKGVLQTLADLKVKPEEFKAKYEEAQAENAKLKRETSLHAVAEAGYSVAALRDFDALEGGLSYVVKDETKDGKTVKSVYVKEGDKERLLDDYAKEKRPALATILRESGQAGNKSYVNQDAGGKSPEGEDFIAKRNKEREAQRVANPNPLMPKNTTAAAANQ